MHVLLTNAVVQEAATEDVPVDESTEIRRRSGSGSDIESGSESDSPTTSNKGKGPSSSKQRTMKKSFLRTCLVLVPKNVLRNWDDELKKVHGIVTRFMSLVCVRRCLSRIWNEQKEPHVSLIFRSHENYTIYGVNYTIYGVIACYGRISIVRLSSRPSYPPAFRSLVVAAVVVVFVRAIAVAGRLPLRRERLPRRQVTRQQQSRRRRIESE